MRSERSERSNEPSGNPEIERNKAEENNSIHAPPQYGMVGKASMVW